MSITLPLGIEDYLQESGFTATEIIVLKKLLEENLLTVREIAMKTGKSNGIIDTAVKKLVRRNIVTKENVNENPRYSIIDPQAIVDWGEKHVKEQTKMLERKHQSFAQFMAQLTVEKQYPEIEHYSGIDGLTKAYHKLLETRAEFLTYTDPASMPSAGLLADFRAQFARRRQVHGVFQRIIAPDSSSSRRFRSRDPFESRRTTLIPPEQWSMPFEKIIAGNIVAYIDLHALQASFIRFQKLAESERDAFERLWAKHVELDAKTSVPNASSGPALPANRLSINVFQKIDVLAFATLSLFWIALFASGLKEGFFNYMYSLLFGLVPLVSGVVVMAKVRFLWGGKGNTIGKAVFLMGLGIFLWGFAQMIWAYYNFALGVALPYPSPTDPVYISGILFYCIGVIYLSDATGAKYGLKNVHAKIFVTIAPLVILALSYYAFVTIARDGVLVPSGGSPMKMLLDIAYPLSDFLGLTIAVLISGLSFRYMGGAYIYDFAAILSGIAVMFVGDFLFSYTTTVGTFYNGNFGDLVYTLGVFLLSFGALGFAKEKTAPMNGCI